MGRVLKYGLATLLALSTIGGFFGGILVSELAVVWKAGLISAILWVVTMVVAFVAGVQLAPRISGGAEARLQGTPDCRELGITHVLHRLDADVRFPVVGLLQTASRSIFVAAYAPMVLKPYQHILINKAQQVPRVEVTVVLPNPRNKELIRQVDRFGEGRGTYAHDLASWLSMLKDCWDKVSDKTRFRVLLTDVMPTFTAIVVDGSRASIQVTGHGWSTPDRLLLKVTEGPFLDQCVRSCDELVRGQNLAEEVTSLEQFDALIASAGANCWVDEGDDD